VVGRQASSSDRAWHQQQQQQQKQQQQHVVVIGAGWGGLSAAHSLSKDPSVRVTVVDASPRVGGLVRDGFRSLSGNRITAEAGQHGFWDNYHNIFSLLRELMPSLDIDRVLTGYAERNRESILRGDWKRCGRSTEIKRLPCPLDWHKRCTQNL
jgi:uncharacterized protein with NAD-binding domain and iron-sulfur cluster